MKELPFDSVARAWREDAAFRARVAADPKAALAEKGLDMSGEYEVRIVVDTPDVAHFVFPPEPGAPLADDALGRIAGGVPAPGRGTGFRLRNDGGGDAG